MVPHRVDDAPAAIPAEFGLEPGQYFTLICRSIPENSILELVRGFSAHPRRMQLAVLGEYHRSDPYQRAVLDAAGYEVLFLGPIYEQKTVSALRFHSAGYLHGHTVGGTNPSLVEAMAAGNPVIAQDNPYNRWTAGEEAAVYFTDSSDVDRIVTQLINDPVRLARMGLAARQRHESEFTWDHVAGQYEEILSGYLSRSPRARSHR